MKYFLPLTFFFIAACNVSSEDTSFDADKIKNQINTNLDQWHEAAAEAEFKPYFDLFSKNGIYIGTDASEIWSVKEFKSFAKPYFDDGKAWSFVATDRNIYISGLGDVVWFDELLDTWMGKCRGSGVFQKRHDKWTLEHYVLSLTIPNNRMDSMIKAIK